MMTSKDFQCDFAYLANRYGWAPADIEEMKTAILANETAGQRYIRTLAAAHRAAYEQTAANGFLRLQDWCTQRKWPWPG